MKTHEGRHVSLRIVAWPFRIGFLCEADRRTSVRQAMRISTYVSDMTHNPVILGPEQLRLYELAGRRAAPVCPEFNVGQSALLATRSSPRS